MWVEGNGWTFCNVVALAQLLLAGSEHNSIHLSNPSSEQQQHDSRMGQRTRRKLNGKTKSVMPFFRQHQADQRHNSQHDHTPS